MYQVSNQRVCEVSGAKTKVQLRWLAQNGKPKIFPNLFWPCTSSHCLPKKKKKKKKKGYPCKLSGEINDKMYFIEKIIHQLVAHFLLF